MRGKLALFTVAATVLAACSEPENLEALIQKRENLKQSLLDIEKKIAVLDTTSANVQTGLLVTWEEAKTGSFTHEIEVQGSIETDRDVLLNAESGGLVQSVLVKEGQRVKKGQVLVQIDNQVISSSIDELKTAIEFAEFNYKKQKELFDQGLGTEFQLVQAKNNLDNLKSRLLSLNTQRGKFSITAPFDGVVDHIYARVGAVAGPQSPVLRLVDNGEIRIVADLSERLYSRIKLGMPVAIHVPSLNDTIITANISNIGNYIHPTNRTFRVQAALKNNRVLLPNMLVRMRISDYTNNNALLIPSESVLIDRNDKSYVFLALKDKKGNMIAQRQDVEVIESYNGITEIRPTAEIQSGTKIVVQGARGLANNDYIRAK
jgi:RND family efflux transporter MFP subunit